MVDDQRPLIRNGSRALLCDWPSVGGCCHGKKKSSWNSTFFDVCFELLFLTLLIFHNISHPVQRNPPEVLPFSAFMIFIKFFSSDAFIDPNKTYCALSLQKYRFVIGRLKYKKWSLGSYKIDNFSKLALLISFKF